MRHLRNPPAQLLTRESGQDLIESALVLPLLLLLVFGIVEFSVLAFRYSTVTNVAREAARAGLLPVNATCNLGCRNSAAESAGAVLATAAGLAPGDLIISAAGSTLDMSRVSVAYDSDLLTGPLIQAFGGRTTVHLAAASSMKRE